MKYGKTKLGGGALQQSDQKPSKEDMRFETQGHLQKLTDAFDIMADPEKMKRVKALAGRHHKAIKSLGDLKEVSKNFQASQDEPDQDDMG